MFLNCKHLYIKISALMCVFDVFWCILLWVFMKVCTFKKLPLVFEPLFNHTIFILLQHSLHSVNCFLQWALLFALFRQTDENFSSLVTLDLGTIDNYNENQLREHLYRQIADYRRLGRISASEKNFNFRSFGGNYHEQWTQLPFAQYFFV